MLYFFATYPKNLYVQLSRYALNIALNGLTSKGLGLPYVGFSDSGQAAVNAFYF
jgi:hypothetical protein